MSKRAVRRHHRERLKNYRIDANWWGHLKTSDSETAQGSVVDTPCSCSCWMCGNPRRYFKQLTKQEELNILDYNEQVREIYEVS